MGSRGKSLAAAARRTAERWHKEDNAVSSEKVSGDSNKEELFAELRNARIKFAEENTVFITRDQIGKITWLEKGNDSVGLTHIQQNHASQFEKALGVQKTDIPNFIKSVIENGKIVTSKPDNGGTNRKYLYKGNYFTVVVTGSNGFIITVFPKRKDKNEEN